ncbi:MAG: SAM-dependent methyltransferase [Actinobacteria bacterium]|uniref:Unannotated protein n=1 Tax=freshwater metagenome TaxID=449393 RepID=A0A6J7A8D0_9ZZZZ|nr:SAM-dependent methyltransferase [Actinomycetota bacterium]MSW79410.1 SAM-dependent methyltransferase [Actinomycetota bacterium]MSX56211.1 SAM-dependent methyltransferase [Actinomycetota bacterium]MSX93640.1 SAM-dependent methyltransferase [Actinomycetota bacterium]MSZ84007.1 SAM-dependent methyltransferase [Actinomycetota bacterium]
MSEAPRGASRSAMLVAACRLLAAELPPDQRLIEDPFASLVCDEEAIAHARADEPLQLVIRMRTKYIDDAVLAFCAEHPGAQVLLLGAGYDARPYRLALSATFYEVDFPATLELREAVYAPVAVATPRVAVPVDLANEPFDAPLIAAGFDPHVPTIVVWEGVINYLTAEAAEAVVHALGSFLSSGSTVIADYVEMNFFRDTQFERTATDLKQRLVQGGERLRGGLPDALGSLDRAGFDVIDDEAAELLPPRYGLPLAPRCYAGRLFTAVRRTD